MWKVWVGINFYQAGSVMLERPHRVPYAHMRHQVAALVADGLTDKQICARLNIRPATVKYHIARLCADWNIDKGKNIRVQITRHLLLNAA